MRRLNYSGNIKPFYQMIQLYHARDVIHKNNKVPKTLAGGKISRITYIRMNHLEMNSTTVIDLTRIRSMVIFPSSQDSHSNWEMVDTIGKTLQRLKRE